MTSDRLLGIILYSADNPDGRFDYYEMRDWPAGAFDLLRRLGLLRQAATKGLIARCPSCGGGSHVESVVTLKDPDGTSRYYIRCPENWREEVAPEMCQWWEVDRAGLGAAVAKSLGIEQTPRAVVPGRFYRLGRTTWPPGSGQTREVVLALAMHEADARIIAAHVGPNGRAIVFIPFQRPKDEIWSDTAPAVISLADVLSLNREDLEVDIPAIIEIVRAADERAARKREMDHTGRKRVRRHVREEIRAMLADDVCVAAYKQHGSYRKAAEALTKQTGTTITKDAIHRAVQRHGGNKECVADADSGSVTRTVAASGRDMARKLMARR